MARKWEKTECLKIKIKAPDIFSFCSLQLLVHFISICSVFARIFGVVVVIVPFETVFFSFALISSLLEHLRYLSGFLFFCLWFIFVLLENTVEKHLPCCTLYIYFDDDDDDGDKYTHNSLNKVHTPKEWEKNDDKFTSAMQTFRWKKNNNTRHKRTPRSRYFGKSTPEINVYTTNRRMMAINLTLQNTNNKCQTKGASLVILIKRAFKSNDFFVSSAAPCLPIYMWVCVCKNVRSFFFWSYLSMSSTVVMWFLCNQVRIGIVY